MFLGMGFHLGSIFDIAPYCQFPISNVGNVISPITYTVIDMQWSFVELFDGGM